jgi:hypothetical protein
VPGTVIVSDVLSIIINVHEEGGATKVGRGPVRASGC